MWNSDKMSRRPLVSAGECSPELHVALASFRAGGTQRVGVNLCNGWVERGRDVSLLVVNGEGPMRAALDPRVRLTDLGVGRLRQGYFQIIRHLRRNSATPVLLLAWDLASGVMLARRLRLFRSPTIFREGSCPQVAVRPCYHWLYRHLLGKADACIAQNIVAKREMEALGVPQTRITVIPNPCLISPDLSGPRPVSGGGLQIIGVGRLSREKAFDQLIRGFKMFHQRHPRARLTILGEGPERGALMELVSNLCLSGVVELPGFAQDMTPWYRRAHVFVLSSAFEGQSNALLEALIRSGRVVCADGAGGTGELMREVGLGEHVVASAGFDLKLGSALESALSEPDEKWIRAARRVSELTSPNRVLARYWEVCADACRR